MVSIPLSYGSSLTGLGLCGARKPDRTSGTIGKITATTRKSAIGPNVPSTLPRSVPLGLSIAKDTLFWVRTESRSGELAAPRRQSLLRCAAHSVRLTPHFGVDCTPCKVKSPVPRQRRGRVLLDGAGGCVALLEALGFVGKTAAPLREWPRMSRLCRPARSRFTHKEVDVSRRSGTRPASSFLGRSRS